MLCRDTVTWWDSVTFHKIDERWGKVIDVESEALEGKSFDCGRVLIYTQHKGLISDIIQISIEEEIYDIMVWEDNSNWNNGNIAGSRKKRSYTTNEGDDACPAFANSGNMDISEDDKVESSYEDPMETLFPDDIVTLVEEVNVMEEDNSVEADRRSRQMEDTHVDEPKQIIEEFVDVDITYTPHIEKYLSNIGMNSEDISNLQLSCSKWSEELSGGHISNHIDPFATGDEAVDNSININRKGGRKAKVDKRRNQRVEIKINGPVPIKNPKKKCKKKEGKKLKPRDEACKSKSFDVISDVDIRRRNAIIRREAMETLELGKRIGLTTKDNDTEVIDKIMLAEIAENTLKAKEKPLDKSQ